MKTATLCIEAVGLFCPHCESFYEHESGSQYFTEEEFIQLPPALECRGCGESFRKPTVTFYRKPKKKASK